MFLVITVIGSLCFLFGISYSVQEKRLQLADITRENKNLSEEAHVLRVDISYLKTPHRIRRLANKYLPQPQKPDAVNRSSGPRKPSAEP